MKKLRLAPTILAILAVGVTLGRSGWAEQGDLPSHQRPYFMPDGKRKEILRLIRREDWAKADHERIKAEADKGDGFWAAFLHALDGDPKYVAPARDWLLKKAEGWVSYRGPNLENPDFFTGGHPWLGDVYYDLDFYPFAAFDWVHKSLDEPSRKQIEQGIRVHARFKLRSMDRWTQTPNLMFKPTFMVAMAGLATQDRELLEWGFHRRPGSARGGYFEALNVMLRDGGPWHEAPIYAIAHEDLWCMAQMSFYRQLYDGRDWFSRKVPYGGSPKGLMDYYLDTAYPPETTADGKTAIRVATYGDGATNPGGDLFLIHPDGKALNLHKELEACYQVCPDLRYAPFVRMVPGHKPALWQRRPLPEKAPFPPAPSTVWPTYGLAMLRSDESPSYWSAGKAIAVFQVMTNKYGHDHADKFGITVHGAGRLLYPDYNAIQYENLAIGWTRNSVAHNTMLVDEQDTRPALPDIRHEFSPELKYLATGASGVFPGVDQTRILMLTDSYLLDVFQAASLVPHTYDYLLHSFGAPRPVRPELFRSESQPGRYTAVTESQAAQTDGDWASDFAIVENGKEAAGVRVTMAGAPGTTVYHGRWGGGLAKLVSERKQQLDRLGTLVVRRVRARETVFVSAHEPYSDGQSPRISRIAVLAQTPQALVVRVDAAGSADFAAVSFGPQADAAEHVVFGPAGEAFAFRNYGYLRIKEDGVAVARGGWAGFRVPAREGNLVLNGTRAKTRRDGDFLAYGHVPTRAGAPVVSLSEEPPFEAVVSPTVARLAQPGRRETVLAVKSLVPGRVSGRVQFELPAGVQAEPREPAFGPIAEGGSVEVRVTFVATKEASPGLHPVPFRFVYRADGREVTTPHLAISLAVGPVLRSVYPGSGRPYFQVHAPLYEVRLDMFHGMPRYLSDDSGAVRLADSPLFTFENGGKPMLFEHTPHAGTWPQESPAGLVAHTLDVCRYRVKFEPDRFTVTMDRDWTPAGKTDFAVPSKWTSPGGAPRWRQVIVLDEAGDEAQAGPGINLKVVAAELEFPGGEWNLAFAFHPAQQVTFDGAGLKFSIGSDTGDAWSVGFCRPGQLEAWRGGKRDGTISAR